MQTKKQNNKNLLTAQQKLVEGSYRDTHFGKHGLDKLASPTVTISCCDDVPTSWDQRKKHGGGCTHA